MVSDGILPCQVHQQFYQVLFHHNLFSCFNGCCGCSWLRESGKMTGPKICIATAEQDQQNKRQVSEERLISTILCRNDISGIKLPQNPQKRPKNHWTEKNWNTFSTNFHLLARNFKAWQVFQQMAVESVCAACGQAEPGKLLAWKCSNWQLCMLTGEKPISKGPCSISTLV